MAAQLGDRDKARGRDEERQKERQRQRQRQRRRGRESDTLRERMREILASHARKKHRRAPPLTLTGSALSSYLLGKYNLEARLRRYVQTDQALLRTVELVDALLGLVRRQLLEACLRGHSWKGQRNLREKKRKTEEVNAPVLVRV